MQTVLIGLAVLVVALAGYVVHQRAHPLVLRAAVEVDATPEQVWRVLADTAAYPQWNPFVVRSTGELVPGRTVENVMVDAEGTERTFRPTLTVVEPGRQLRWIGRLYVPGIFDGEHAFVIEPLGEGKVRFEQVEHFRGVLVPPLAGMLRRVTLPQFEAMNAALAERVRATIAG